MDENKEDVTVEKEVEIEVEAEGEESAEAKEPEVVNEDSEETSSDEVEQKGEEEDFKSKFFYLAAEMDNMKKRFEREKDNLLKFGNEKVLKGLLEVVDNLDRTVDAISGEEDEKVKNIYSGIEMVRNQFLNVLKANGLEQVNALGETFDPNFHEAMAQQPAEGKEDQEIIQVFQHGYTLNGRLIRPAKVVIAKND
ncbi:MAG: nucleotide exchange factor GrpE [Halobacteriovoraceae bacterium]|nr:nucleotide exchange factor GrpE [Halobacteriovoraceae bacterium]